MSVSAFLLALAFSSPAAWAAPSQEPPAEKAREPAPEGAERVSVDAIKEKYWARGQESELGVVQNRAYSKEHKLDFGVYGGVLTTDPFLSVKSAGASVGFHFSEYLALHFLGWKSFVDPSSALVTFQEVIGATTNNNPPKFYAGAEGTASILYGKLSLIGKAIIYYDFHFQAGLGVTGTENGNYLTPSLGLGQQIYITKQIALRIDYRLMRYEEHIIEKVVPARLGEVRGIRENWTNAITFGVHFFLGLPGAGLKSGGTP